MGLSQLQKYILNQSYLAKNGSSFKADFYGFYPAKEITKSFKNIQNTVHKSLEGLVTGDYLVAFGYQTAKKWHIRRVKLTAKGKKLVKVLIKKRQRKLPKI